jgi:hypothetical protein
VLRSPLRLAGSWLAGPTLRGWLVVRVVLVLGLLAPALGLGGWVHPAAAAHAQSAEPGLHAGPSAPGDPAAQAFGLARRGEAEDTKDAEDDVRERTPFAPLWLAPSLPLDLAAAARGHRLADAHHGGPGSCYRGALHNRGPPRA